MANILLTQRCVRSCPYCFAKQYMDTPNDGGISWENLLYLADLFETSGFGKIQILGGEPTLHPDFVDMVAYLLDRKFEVSVFTSGIMSDKKLSDIDQYLSEHVGTDLTFLCNVNEPSLSPAKETDRLHKFLSRFGYATALGFNMYRIDMDMTFLSDYVSRYKTKTNIRLGLANPILGEKTDCLPVSQLHDLGQKVIGFLMDFERNGIVPQIDCGMPLCAFSDEDLGQLYRLSGGRLHFRCEPALDIGPDMMVWACFPLHKVKKRSVFEFDSIHEMNKYYLDLFKRLRDQGQRGIYDACLGCREYARGVCAGGCIGNLPIRAELNEVIT